MSVAVAGAGAAPGAAAVVDGAGTDADGLGGSDDEEVGVVHAPDITHHNTNTNAPMTITLIKSRSMVASTLPGSPHLQRPRRVTYPRRWWRVILPLPAKIGRANRLPCGCQVLQECSRAYGQLLGSSLLSSPQRKSGAGWLAGVGGSRGREPPSAAVMAISGSLSRATVCR